MAHGDCSQLSKADDKTWHMEIVVNLVKQMIRHGT